MEQLATTRFAVNNSDQGLISFPAAKQGKLQSARFTPSVGTFVFINPFVMDGSRF
jgi:hypothetical protein